MEIERTYVMRGFSEEVDLTRIEDEWGLKIVRETITLPHKRYDELSQGWNTDNLLSEKEYQEQNGCLTDEQIFNMILEEQSNFDEVTE